MRKYVAYSNRTEESIVVPTCDTCKYKKARQDFVAPQCIGYVDYCSLRLVMAYPHECSYYEMRWLTRIVEKVRSFLGL